MPAYGVFGLAWRVPGRLPAPLPHLIPTSNEIIGSDRELFGLLKTSPPASVDNIQGHHLISPIDVVLVVFVHKGFDVLAFSTCRASYILVPVIMRAGPLKCSAVQVQLRKCSFIASQVHCFTGEYSSDLHCAYTLELFAVSNSCLPECAGRQVDMMEWLQGLDGWLQGLPQ